MVRVGLSLALMVFFIAHVSDQLLAIFGGPSMEVKSVSSIDGKLSSERLLGSLKVTVAPPGE